MPDKLAKAALSHDERERFNMDITKSMISEWIKKLNEAENSRPHRTVEETIAAIDSLMAPDSKFRYNKEPFHDRKTERKGEKVLFTMISDYHRTLETIIIDPPYAAFEWIMTGTISGKRIEIHACSVLECNTDGLFKQGTVYIDNAQWTSPKS